MLGSELAKTIAPLVPKGQLTVLGRESLDITDMESVARLRRLVPKVVINAAAYTNVDGAETERERALAINQRGAANLASICKELKSTLVHFSTDQVFDGCDSVPRSESDPVRPSNYYAETKHLGEKEALRYEGSLVLRVQWLYGEKKDRFTILRGKDVFTPFSDQFGAPTWTLDLSQVTAKLISIGATGLYHFTYDDFASWADVYQFVKMELRLDTLLMPRRTADVKLPARRPLYSVMSNRKLIETLGVSGLGGWREPLREFLARK